MYLQRNALDRRLCGMCCFLRCSVFSIKRLCFPDWERGRTSPTARGADIVVVADLAKVSSATQWQACLNGGSIAQLNYVTSGGAEGACIVFAAAVLASPRQIWTSAEFAARCPVQHALLQEAVAVRGSKWTFFAGSAVEFVTKALKTKSLIGLVTCAEYAAFPPNFVKVLTANNFIRETRVIELGNSQVSG